MALLDADRIILRFGAEFSLKFGLIASRYLRKPAFSKQKIF